MNYSKYNSKLDPKNTVDSAKKDPKTVTPTVRVDVPKTPSKQTATTPTEKAGQAMINEGGHSVVIDAPNAVREPNALTGNLPEAPTSRGNGAAGPQTPVLKTKPVEGTHS